MRYLPPKNNPDVRATGLFFSAGYLCKFGAAMKLMPFFVRAQAV